MAKIRDSRGRTAADRAWTPDKPLSSWQRQRHGDSRKEQKLQERRLDAICCALHGSKSRAGSAQLHSAADAHIPTIRFSTLGRDLNSHDRLDEREAATQDCPDCLESTETTTVNSERLPPVSLTEPVLSSSWVSCSIGWAAGQGREGPTMHGCPQFGKGEMACSM